MRLRLRPREPIDSVAEVQVYLATIDLFLQKWLFRMRRSCNPN
ncbi:hypothetical protein [Brevibacillus centrosporus]